MSGCIVERLESVFVVGGFRVVYGNALVSYAVVVLYTYISGVLY